jgi:hypothetical protein
MQMLKADESLHVEKGAGGVGESFPRQRILCVLGISGPHPSIILYHFNFTGWRRLSSPSLILDINTMLQQKKFDDY